MPKSLRICLTYPPLKSKKGRALLSQNRQFQWSRSPTIAFPVIPASAATLLKKHGHQVLWLDAIAEKLSFSDWLKQITAFKPDLIFIETKTPVIKQHWRIIKKLKKISPQTKIVLAGDHVTALPQESFKNCPVDHIIQGGHYDLALLKLTKDISSASETAVGGSSPEVRSGLIDRQLTNWRLYAYNNGNFQTTPGAYTMFARDCWWRKAGGCSFCSWTTIFPQFSVRSVENCLQEVGQLITLGVKEIFDDSGTFPAGRWLTDFCQGMIKKGYHKKITLGCNLRFGVLTKKDYRLMRRAGFRFLLFGLESANQKTLDKLNKGIKINRVQKELEIIKNSSSDGDCIPMRAPPRWNPSDCETRQNTLEPHITCMIGYPWETKQNALKTINFTKNLFKKGLIASLQATIIIPYPGTRLFKQAKKNGWLKTLNWDKYDMSRPVLKSPLSDQEIHRLVQGLYLSALTPRFVLKTLKNLVQNPRRLPYYLKSTLQYLARLLDFV